MSSHSPFVSGLTLSSSCFKSGVQRGGSRLVLGPCQRDTITRIRCNKHPIIYPTVISVAEVH